MSAVTAVNGYPIDFRAHWLDQQLDAMPAEAEAAFLVLLGKITALRSEIEAARGRLKAAEVGKVKLNGNELEALWQEDLKLCQALGNIIGSPVEWHPAISRGRTFEVEVL